MAHINLQNDLPGIRGLMAYRPETAKPLNELAEILLRSDDNTLPRGERELIGSYVSHLNGCFFCENVHGSMAGHYLNCNLQTIDSINANVEGADLSEKIKTLFLIARAVQQGGKQVTEELVEAARSHGATDLEIHDTVLIAAAFCMFNRYVDGLATWAPENRQFYVDRAATRAAEGYVHFDLFKK